MAEKVHHLAGLRSGKRLTGVSLVTSGALLWGISGNVAQYLFQTQGFHAGWMTSVRMLTAGFLLILTHLLRDRNTVWKIWLNKDTRRKILIFGSVGMIGSQYTYFAAVAAGNAATATLLQYLGPVIIMTYLIVKWRKKPARSEVLAVLLALTGVFLLVTKGHPDQIAISPAAFIWGILSAFGGAIYSMQPSALIRKWGAGIVVGWGMIVGGIIMSLFYPPWTFSGEITTQSIAALAFVILFGTLAAFSLYLESLKYLQPAQTSLLGCAEPLSAAVISVVWMGVPFTLADWMGSACIIGTVIVLSLTQK
ncbi:EamA family transporter [Sporolactobacillus sp. THM7-4]|nr:EamA family transporter [Sporolactobacillus sp. THM7-4]